MFKKLKILYYLILKTFYYKIETKIFEPSTGGAEAMCKEMDVRFLGKIPLDLRIGQCCDEGKSFIKEFPTSPATEAYKKIISEMEKQIDPIHLNE